MAAKSRVRKAPVRFVGRLITGAVMQYVVGYIAVGHPFDYPLIAGLVGTGIAIMPLLFG